MPAMSPAAISMAGRLNSITSFFHYGVRVGAMDSRTLSLAVIQPCRPLRDNAEKVIFFSVFLFFLLTITVKKLF